MIKKLLKFAILITVIILIAIYLPKFFNHPSQTKPVKINWDNIINNGINAVQTTTSHFASSTKNKINSLYSNAFNTLKQKTNEELSNLGKIISNFGNSLITSSSDINISNLPNTNIPNTNIATTVNNSAGNISYYFIVFKNQPFSLSINNNINYNIDWGDNTKTSGKTSTTTKIITHSWPQSGIYSVNMILQNSNASTSTSITFYINVQ
ncbi:MAG: hypothetical protein ACP5IC_00420 [Minisyncoccia bacterium]